MKQIAAIMMLALAFLFTGCNEKTEETQVHTTREMTEETIVEETTQFLTTEEETEEETTQVPNPHENEMQSNLNGAWVSVEEGRKRPVAVMMNNIKASTPQSHIAQADVVYEAPVEGGITRFMALFSDVSELGDIGSVRSARTYYAILQHEWDAVFCHYGQAVFAEPYTNNDAFCDNLNGLEGIGNTVYYRVKWKKSPNNAYTSGERILEGISKMGYRTSHTELYAGGPLMFADEGEEIAMENSIPASKVEIGLTVSKPWYEYHAEDGLYYRYQYEQAHTDETTKEQVACKNLIIQYVPWEYY
ncbi:MAG: DUF3048 domain-containing protein, partial [Lachnospiraceae bacterium]|nr:DUF3048 domain-containing protein [Lachnospiraceae bacterium]